MLIKLFGSKARVSLLKLFLLNPEEKYYVRQLARRLGLQVNSVSRELENLEHLGLLASSIEFTDTPGEAGADLEEGNERRPKVDAINRPGKNPAGAIPKQIRKYHKANRNFVLYDEIRNLIIRSQVLYEKDFAEKLKSVGQLKLLILSGIFVGSENGPVDILLVGKINKQKFSSIIEEMEKELEKELNYTVMDPGEFKYRKDITDVFLYNILEGKKLIVIDEIGLL